MDEKTTGLNLEGLSPDELSALIREAQKMKRSKIVPSAQRAAWKTSLRKHVDGLAYIIGRWSNTADGLTEKDREIIEAILSPAQTLSGLENRFSDPDFVQIRRRGGRRGTKAEV